MATLSGSGDDDDVRSLGVEVYWLPAEKAYRVSWRYGEAGGITAVVDVAVPLDRVLRVRRGGGGGGPGPASTFDLDWQAQRTAAIEQAVELWREAVAASEGTG